MLKRYNQVFLGLMAAVDVATVGGAWIAAYWLRFYVVPWRLTKGIPEFDLYLRLCLLVIPVAIFSIRVVGLYSSYRVRGLLAEFFDVLQAVVLTVIVVAVTSFFYRDYSLSRMVMAAFGVFAITGLTATRAVLRSSLRYLRSKGLNQRHVLIIGAGPLGRSLAGKMAQLGRLGLNVAGFLDDGLEPGEEVVPGIPLLGGRKDLERVLRERPVDQVYIALPRQDHQFAEEALVLLSSRMVDIKIVPDYLQFVALRSSVDDFDGTPVINLSEKPLWGPKALLKRGFDFLFSMVGLVILSPVLAAIALLVRATSPGPVFYRQERVGYDGHRFQMVKFRSMRVEGDDAGEPRWTVPGDPRRTPVGRVLRRLSLDELPQLWNILKGEMSFVGPRPERSFYVKKFSDRDPRYMWRHRVRAGLTGWAQVNGLRGDTSIEERTEYDLFYVRNWSFRLDLKIITLTLMRVLFDRHAY